MFTSDAPSDPSFLPAYDPMAGMGMGDAPSVDVGGDASGGGMFDSFDLSGAMSGLDMSYVNDAFDTMSAGNF